MTAATSFSTVLAMKMMINEYGLYLKRLASQNASAEEGDNNSASQPSQWIFGCNLWEERKKGRVAGLGSLGQSVKAHKQSTSALPKEIDEMIKSQVYAFNFDLYARLQEERRKNKRMRKELDLLKKHVYDTIIYK
ncbi:hypothetical protein RND71_037342 [Anisodus tanguticus]|uniref:Uncharacterized protein n=1 Tax=Anisodus tanguticus TaxID=243964 RepID=A0AAE1R362_9SOLA|nr:hypothetical protein RND71_037342 [Anisodus tanguticus]